MQPYVSLSEKYLDCPVRIVWSSFKILTMNCKKFAVDILSDLTITIFQTVTKVLLYKLFTFYRNTKTLTIQLSVRHGQKQHMLMWMKICLMVQEC